MRQLLMQQTSRITRKSSFIIAFLHDRRSIAIALTENDILGVRRQTKSEPPHRATKALLKRHCVLNSRRCWQESLIFGPGGWTSDEVTSSLAIQPWKMTHTMEQSGAPSAAKSALNAPSDQSLRVPCFCEENVWRLAYKKLQAKTTNSKEYFVVFITNPMQCVPMFHQMAAKDPSKPCYWDYHVILVSYSESKKPSALVYDMDSHLPYPCSLELYLSSVFPCKIQWPADYLPYFRWVASGAITTVSDSFVILTMTYFRQCRRCPYLFGKLFLWSKSHVWQGKATVACPTSIVYMHPPIWEEQFGTVHDDWRERNRATTAGRSRREISIRSYLFPRRPAHQIPSKFFTQKDTNNNMIHNWLG